MDFLFKVRLVKFLISKTKEAGYKPAPAFLMSVQFSIIEPFISNQLS
jgi:hypothetical protein